MEYILTCWSNITPKPKSTPGRVSETKQFDHFVVRSPAPIDAAKTRTAINRELKGWDIDNCPYDNPQESREWMKNHQLSLSLEELDRLESVPNGIGIVRGASGSTTSHSPNKKRTMNWVLIESSGTYQENIPPPAGRVCWDIAGGVIGNSGIYSTLPVEKTISTFSKPEPGSWVVSMGRRLPGLPSQDDRGSRGRGPGTGTVNAIGGRIDGLWFGREETVEVECLPEQQMGTFQSYWGFSAKGDMGTWVVNERKELVSMVTGWDAVHSYGSGFICPIGDIIRDIEEKMKGKIHLPGGQDSPIET